MAFLKQLFISLLVIVGVIGIWVSYVPSSMPWLERVGILDILGIEAATQEQSNASRPGFQRGPPRVVVAPVQIERQKDRISAIGDGRAYRSVTLRAEVAGRVSELAVRSGQYVQAGTVMLRLDDGEERIALERARLLLEDAISERDRVIKLSGTGAVTAVRQQETRLAVENAALAVQQAEFDLTQKKIISPISGWVGLLEIEEGERVAAQEALMLIADRSRILLDFRVPERVVSQLETQMSFTATPLGLRGTVLSGTLAAIDNRVDRTSRTLRLRGILDNEQDLLRDGMAFSVAMEFEGNDFPSVPPLAVQWSSEGAFVWILQEGKTTRAPIRIKQRNAESVLVEGDLSDGILVVVEGVQSLRPGVDVEITETRSRRPDGISVAPVATSDPAKL